jgi:hypothetical protein
VQATCTDGPSLPTESPEAITSGLFFDFRTEMKPHKALESALTSVKLLMRNVQKPRKPRMTKPDNIHLISEMPEPAAYFAKERTRLEATKEKVAFV